MDNLLSSTPVQGEEINVSSDQGPIPTPSHPRQYRAIGLIQGQYTPSKAQTLTRGKLLTHDGITIDAVILGRVISIIKNHVDLSQSHLWVVYPRTRAESNRFHVQIVGIWEPRKFDSTLSNSSESESLIPISSGYFSVRGEVVYSSVQKEIVIVKIRQSPKTSEGKPIFFKLQLKGTIEEKSMGYFWDFQVQLVGTILKIEKATNMGRLLPVKKPKSEETQAKGKKNNLSTVKVKPFEGTKKNCN